MSIMIIIILFVYSSYLTLEKYIVTGHIFRLRKNDISPREPAPGNIPESEETPEVTAPENIVGKSNFQIGQSMNIADNTGQGVAQEEQQTENNLKFTPQSPSQQSLQPTFPSWLQQSGQGFGRGNNQNQQGNNAEFPLKFPPNDSEYHRWGNSLAGHEGYPHRADYINQSQNHKPATADEIPERKEVLGRVERNNPHEATGVTFDDMEAIENTLTRDNSSEQEKERARNTFQRLKGTDMERLLRASILGSSQKIRRYMDLYIGQKGGRPLTPKTKETILGIFDIEEYV
ncbi:MAG: hypothetical protein HPZ83_13155 [Odoribacter sp.]|nr:hypothetical protein [Odoribacter sp.]